MLKRSVSAALRVLKAQSVGTSAVRISALATQFLVILVLGSILPKDNFGDMMIVFGAYRLISIGVGSGFSNLITYHTSRDPTNYAADIRLLRSISIVSGLICTVIAAFFVIFSQNLSELFSKPGMEEWFVYLAPMLPMGALTLVSSGSLDGQSRITRSVSMYELLPSLLRLPSLLICLLVGSAPSAVGLAMWLPMLVPYIADNRRLLSAEVKGLSPLSKWDLRYSGLLSFNAVAGQHLQGIDILVVGFFFSSAIAADYALASRFAVLFPFFQFIFVRQFVPRLGLLVKQRDWPTINTEMRQLRLIGLLSVCVTVVGIVTFSPMVLDFVGPFSQVVVLVMALAIPALLRGAFTGADAALKMMDKPGLAAFSAVFGLLLILVVPAITQKSFGIISVPLAMYIYAILINTILFFSIKKQHVLITDLQILFISIISQITIAFGVVFYHGSAPPIYSLLGPLLGILALAFLIKRERPALSKDDSHEVHDN